MIGSKQAAAEAAYCAACLAELDALKPGNVHRFAAGHDMTVDDFTRSAEVSARPLCDLRLGVGEAVYRAVAATREAVGCNTNLGILLLCAPLARAALALAEGTDLRARLGGVLEALDRDDADFAFRAIRLAGPAGLGTSPRHDVHDPATVTLRAAMAEAAHRDRIAAQYVDVYADIFEVGLPRLHDAIARTGDEAWAITALYLGFLAAVPDSHVARKHGGAVAETLRQRVVSLERRMRESSDPQRFQSELLALDRALKHEGLNPGTSADLTVATLFARALEAGQGRVRI